MKTEIRVTQGLVDELLESFVQGPMFDDSGRRMLNEEQVVRINNMSLVIFADEHPPPHFHVKFAGENASFNLADGRRLPGVKGLEKYDLNILKWWKQHRCLLISTWNTTRPADCQVGPMPVPPECLPDDSS